MKNFKRSNDKGFTIIEVLIVLAIAGLILLVVFLAVPALQRNARNTQRTGDISRVLGASQEIINNGGGQVTALSGATSAEIAAAVGNYGYYQAANVTVSATAPAAGGVNTTTVDTVVVYTGATCVANARAVPGTARQIAVTYTKEAAIPQCTNS